MIALVDLSMGNLHSVARALTVAGAERSGGAATEPVELTADPAVIARASRVVLPGQGAFRDGALALGANGGALASAVREAIASGRPVLGICLGLQLLFDASEEAPGARGLGVFPGTVQQFDRTMTDADGEAIKVPHMGWNRIHIAGETTPEARRVLGECDWYYFTHSYHAVPRDPAVAAARAMHGFPFVAAIAHESLLAVQFHPEKSQRAGLALLGRWLAQ